MDASRAQYSPQTWFYSPEPKQIWRIVWSWVKGQKQARGTSGLHLPAASLIKPSVPIIPTIRPSSFFLPVSTPLIHLDSPFTCVVWCQLLWRFLYYLSLCVYLLLNQSLSFSRTRFVLLTSICSSWSLPQCRTCRYLSMYLLNKGKDRWLESEEIAPQMKTENEMRPEKEESVI